MSSTTGITADELTPIYLSGLRQRFRAELGRMTRGAMAELLQGCEDVGQLSFLMSYLYIYHWLQHNVDPAYQAGMLAPFNKGSHAFLMDLLLDSDSAAEFVQGYIRYWQGYNGEPELQQQNLLQLFAACDGDARVLGARVLALWEGLGLFTRSYAVAYGDLAREEKARYQGMLGVRTVNAWPWWMPCRTRRPRYRRFRSWGSYPAWPARRPAVTACSSGAPSSSRPMTRPGSTRWWTASPPACCLRVAI